MWSDNDIDNAFRRLDPAEPEPAPFPLDAWLKLDAALDQAVIDRAVRRRLWQFFAAEVAAVALVGLGWLLWPASTPASASSKEQAVVAPASSETSTAIKRLQKLETATKKSAAAPSARSAVGSVAPAAPRPATGPYAAAPTATLATNAAPIAAAASTAINSKEAGRGLYVPPASVLVPLRQPGSTARLPLPAGRKAVAGKPTVVPVELVAEASEKNSPARKARQKAAVGSPEITVVAVAQSRTGASKTAEVGREHKEITGRFAGSQMATSSRVASEVAVADAASHSGSPLEATPAGGRLLTTLEPNIRAVNDGPDDTTTSTTRHQHSTARSTPDLVSALSVAPARPAADSLPATLAAAALVPNPLPAAVPQPRFYVGVVAAPDVSTVKFADVRAPRLNVGLTLEYRLGQRWRVATGIQRSTKDYYARREDYDWSNYPRAYTRDFSWVDGSCTVIDVPLNLRYDALIGPRYRVFGTAGLSSFFMQHERYTYDYYDNTSNAPAVWDRSFANENRHLFSVLNLSAGYEYGLGTHWRLQAEPYVKVPLAGVGAGKVKLLSAGVYLGVKYGF